ncbi:MAG: hypothetical protein QGG39_11980, partial [Candidatus Poribacteria bacterium]|nr:hypothetical protein [Candidatus Poribacteria bacterium]
FVPMLGILSEDDHAYILEDSGAQVLIAPAAGLAERARALKGRQPALRQLISNNQAAMIDYHHFQQAGY